MTPEDMNKFAQMTEAFHQSETTQAFDACQEKSNQMARQLAMDLDGVIKEAIEEHTGRDVVVSEVKRLGMVKVHPNGVQVYSYDGVDILELHPVEFDHSEPFKIKATRKYRKLT